MSGSRLLRACMWAFVSYAVARAVLAVSPFPALDRFRERDYSAAVYDQSGRLMHVAPLEEGLRRQWSPLDAVPSEVVSAFLAAEDSRYYLHNGVDPAAVFRALLQNRRSRRIVSGAGTVSMQLARMVRGRSTSVAGKVGEALDALRIEARLSKPQILELWLNGLPFGGQVEGIGSAARRYFGIEVGELSWAEAAVLAVLARNPTLYNPISYPDAVVAAAGSLRPPGRGKTGSGNARLLRSAVRTVSLHPWPVEARHAVSLLASRRPARTTTLHSTIDPAVQRTAEELLSRSVAEHAGSRIRNGAALVVDHRSGEILAYVGTHDFHDDAAGQIDGVRTLNQPGSLLKPFLYALAIDSGFRPNTLLPDVPLSFGTSNVYVPRNFNGRYNGPIRLRAALASSLNVPAVYTLERIGARSFASFLVRMGFESIASGAAEAGLGLALGNAPVSLYELVQGFSVFARGGTVVRLSLLRADAGSAGLRVMSPYAAWIVADILSDGPERAIGFGSSALSGRAQPLILKTGTANQFQDIWAVGSTGRFTIGVWMGNHAGRTVIGRTGASVPAAVVEGIAAGLSAVRGEPSGAATAPPRPSGIEEHRICTTSGEAAGPLCTATRIEYLRYGDQVEQCRFHRELDGRIVVMYPPEYALWAERAGVRAAVDRGSINAVRIVSPPEGAVFFAGPSKDGARAEITVEAHVPPSSDGSAVRFYRNDLLVGTAAAPESGVLRVPITLERGSHRIAVDLGARASRHEVAVSVR